MGGCCFHADRLGSDCQREGCVPGMAIAKGCDHSMSSGHSGEGGRQPLQGMSCGVGVATA